MDMAVRLWISLTDTLTCRCNSNLSAQKRTSFDFVYCPAACEINWFCFYFMSLWVLWSFITKYISTLYNLYLHVICRKLFSLFWIFKIWQIRNSGWPPAIRHYHYKNKHFLRLQKNTSNHYLAKWVQDVSLQRDINRYKQNVPC